MNTTLKLYKYVDGVNDTNFPSDEDQIYISSYKYNVDRMGDAPTITASINNVKCLDSEWDSNVYTLFKGEKFFLNYTPSSSKDNESITYGHELEFKSERDILSHVYFIDAVTGDSEKDKEKSNSTNVNFYGDIKEFSSRLNAAMQRKNLSYTTVVDDGISTESVMVSFEDEYIINVIQDVYDLYGIPYYFEGNVVHFGMPKKVILDDLEYGRYKSLISVSRNNEGNGIINKCTAVGSSDNIPSYYPNLTEKGDVVAKAGTSNLGIKDDNIQIENAKKFSEKVNLTDKITYEKVEASNVHIFAKETIGISSEFHEVSSVFICCYNLEMRYEFESEVDNAAYTLSYENLTGEFSGISEWNLYDSTDAKISTGSGFGNSFSFRIEKKGSYYVTVNRIIGGESKMMTVTNPKIQGESYCWHLNGEPIDISEIGLYINGTPVGNDTITQERGNYITPCTSLMPSIYRESSGEESFYEAKNNTYQNGNGDYYTFENEYSAKNPREYKTSFEDIKPTIVGIQNANGERIDLPAMFAYDLDDNETDVKDSESNELKHSYFYMKLKKFDGDYGFNLFDHAIDNDTMRISFTSGSCGACEFEIGVDEETPKNIVQVDDQGNLLRDSKGNVLLGEPQDRQNDTRNYEVWIALKKDDSTYGDYRPNALKDIKPTREDTFVILGIDLPNAYVLNAEKKLENEIIKYMFQNNTEKFSYSAKFSRIFLAENKEILDNLDENSSVSLVYNGIKNDLYISSYSYSVDENESLPEIEVEMTSSVSTSSNSLDNYLSSVKEEIIVDVNKLDYYSVLAKSFLRKDVNDVAKELITFLKGIQIGNQYSISNDGIAKLFSAILYTAYISGNIQSDNFVKGTSGSGFLLTKTNDEGRSYLEVDDLYVRAKAIFESLEIKKLSYVGGNLIITPAGMECTKVETVTVGEESAFRCYFKGEEDGIKVQNEFAVGDLAQCKEFNVETGRYDEVSNQYYWRKVIGVGENYIDLSMSDCDTGSTTPMVGDDIVQLGNVSDTARQSAIIIATYGDDAPYMKMYRGINSYSLTGKEFVTISREKVSIIADELKFASGEDVKDQINNVNNELAEYINFANQISKDLEAVKNQVDGAIETWFYDPVPTLSNEPAVNWTTDEDKNSHLGDLYYDGNGKAYRFQMSGSSYIWYTITDSDITKALADAKNAQDTADGKRRVFVETPTLSSEYDVGDLWVNATYGIYTNDLLRCKTAKKKNEQFSIQHWELASKYTDDQLAQEAKEVAEQAKQDAQDAKAAADKANQAIEDLELNLDEAFSDGIISRAEAIAISKYINQINESFNSVKATYESLYNNIYLQGDSKTNLKTKYDALVTSKDSLLSEINNAISDDKATTEESQAVDTAFEKYNTSVSEYQTAVEQANESIQNKIKSYSDEAIAKAEQALEDAQDANKRLDSWASDGVISPVEKQELKSEIVIIDSDFDEFTNDFTRYDLDWGDDDSQAYYNSYTAYRAKLVELSSSSQETYPIGNLRELQEAYYDARTNIIIKINDAQQKYTDDTKNDIIQYVNSEITATKDEFTTNYNKVTTDLETFKKETNTKFEQTAEDISLKADSTVVNQLGDVVSQHSSLISQNASKIESTVSSITTLEGELSSQIKQTADNIYLGIESKFKYNLFIDGSFERGYNKEFTIKNIPDHNDGLDTNPIVISGGKFGDYCLQVKQWGSGDSYFYLNQRVPVESNTAYTLVFWHRDFGVEGTSSSYIEESYKSGDNYSVVSNDYIRTTHSTTWHIEVIQITTRSNTEYLRLRFGRNGTGYSWSEFDGIMIFKGAKEYQSEEGGEIVTRKNYPEDSFIDNELNEDKLYQTGIDISNRKITVTSDTFEVKNNDNKVTASINSDGVIETNGGVFNNVTVNGSLRQPWVFLIPYVDIESGLTKYKDSNGQPYVEGQKYDNIMFDSLATNIGTKVTNVTNIYGNGGKLNNVQLVNNKTYRLQMGYIGNTVEENELDPICDWLYGDSGDIGRVVTLIHLPSYSNYDDFYNLDQANYLVIEAPSYQSGNDVKLFRFYDPDVVQGTAGRQNDKLVLHNEIVELYGFGVDNVFKGWIVRNRTKFTT